MKKIITFIALSTYAFATQLNAQSWSLTGNSGTNAATNFIGTSDNQPLKIKTNNAVRINITSGGKVGIGSATPAYKFDVKGGSINTDSCYRINGSVMLTLKGTGSIAVGDSAGAFTTGNYNTFNGWYAGKSNVTGDLNTMIGANSGSKNTTGSGNTFTGLNSGMNNENGGDNCFYGNGAGMGNVSGNDNIFIGYGAGKDNTSGNNNVAIGYYTGDNCSTGSNNTFLGNYAGFAPLVSNLTNASAIGAFATVETSNSMVFGGLDAYAVKVGIGITAPTSTLDVKTNNTTATAIKGKAINVGGNGIIGESNNGTNAYGVWGKSTSGFAGYFSGNLAYTGTISNVSDERLKENIESFENALDMIMKVDVKTYTFKKEYEKMNLPKGEQIGFIAQNLEKTFPNLIVETADKSMNDSIPLEIKTVNYIGMIPVLAEAIKELNSQLKSLITENKQLKNEIAEMKSMFGVQNGSQKIKKDLNNSSISVSPNPANDKTIVTFSNLSGASVQLNVVDNTGKIIFATPVEKNASQFELNTNLFSNGSYLIQIIADGKMETTSKLFVNK